MAKSTILSSDANGMTLRMEMPELKFAPQTGGGKSWTQLVLPKSDTPRRRRRARHPGHQPQLRRAGRREALGRAGQHRVVHDRGRRRVPRPGRAAGCRRPIPGPPKGDPNNPLKPNFLTGQFAQPPFQQDASAYKTDAFVPAAAASGQILGQARDITIGGLSIPAAQYNAADRTLKVLNTVDVRATFEGGAKTFSPELNSPWERAQQTFVVEPAERGHHQVQAPVRHSALR